ncbi:CO/xanthine dehydrogenase Mo-binding subunit [Streptacidiphilus sp. MAP12-16]
MRRAAAAANDPERINLWAGTGFPHATAEPTVQILDGWPPECERPSPPHRSNGAGGDYV